MVTKLPSFKTKKGTKVHGWFDESKGEITLQIFNPSYGTSFRKYDTSQYVSPEDYIRINKF